MKIKTLILIAAIAACAQFPDPHSIAAFNITSDERAEVGNFVIRPQTPLTGSDTLTALASPPPFIRPGQAVMRKKFGADYRLYIGELDSAAFRAFPPVYAFPLPAWSRSGQAMWYRFYAKPTDNRSLDLETVFFDNERAYVQHHSKIYYSRNDEWDSISGVNAAPYGELYIDSEPPGADIYFYGQATGKKTPAKFKDMIAGRYEVELFLSDYRFQRRSVSVPAGGEASSSFHLMSDFDTLLVLGENQHGVLVLPHPPIDSEYRVGDSAAGSGLQIQLLEGEYRVVWKGLGLYKNIDTVIAIPPGQMVYFNAPFVRLTGSAAFELMPQDAIICVEGFPCGIGDMTVELPSGFHTARISRHGYEPERRKFIISHDKKYRIKITLDQNSDRDYDGFPDSIDRCPDVYGLYDGCPKPNFRTAARIYYEDLIEYMESEPFSFTVAGIGFISRSPTNRHFRHFVSSFSGSNAGGFNNYGGMTVGNMYQVSYRGFTATLELGQWSSGVKYQRPDTVTINTGRDRYIIWYDSLYKVEPTIYFPSTALSVGFKYRLDRYSIGYNLGFQWEDIEIEQLQRVWDKEFVNARFDNDWMYHEIVAEMDMFMDMFATPSLYMKFKFPFGPTLRTKWHVIQMGLQFRMRPVNWKKRN